MEKLWLGTGEEVVLPLVWVWSGTIVAVSGIVERVLLPTLMASRTMVGDVKDEIVSPLVAFCRAIIATVSVVGKALGTPTLKGT